ncbi:Methyltransferase type 11 [Halothece sp. PCC 7418]|uniref:class I SAM-dependent methyltransferase n=1 Tax=Halothece sp. (strain PCC 7418) TaxID=65093 RepID=UPI0002A07887|nr:methyltransferase domain-containing protein [Halothece sp. PCC 7418]AFZ44639.1 Methyltransferase type 11 [Halothece sp. PCC 7418]
MTTTTVTQSDFRSRLVNGILGIKPIYQMAKSRARNMMIKRAEEIGVPWRDRVAQLKQHDWDSELATIQNPNLNYPDYYTCSFHAYEKGNLSWEAALEVEVAAYAVHAKLWDDSGADGDQRLRDSYHEVLQEQLPTTPETIVDLGCSVGMSSFALQERYPEAKITGVDLSPYFLSVAQYQARQKEFNIQWQHAAAEATELPSHSYDLVSAFLMFHELPQQPAKAIFQEAKRLVKPGGYFCLMDMNPQSPVYQKMPPYVFTLLKSTEPYLDEYFTLDLHQALTDAGFAAPKIIPNSPRHRTVIAYKPED